jgi:putative tricarboxylic transport membrane protein
VSAEWEGQAGVPSGGSPPAGRRLRLRREPEFVVSAFLLILGLVVLYETTLIGTAAVQRGPVGPKAVPTVVGVALLVLAVVHAIDVARGGHGEAEAGEDVEAGTRADWRTVAMVVAAFVLNIFLIDILGWILSGALLFWITARALGSRHAIRDVGIALGMGIVSFLIFAYGLGLALPGGVLEPVLP